MSMVLSHASFFEEILHLQEFTVTDKSSYELTAFGILRFGLVLYTESAYMFENDLHVQLGYRDRHDEIKLKSD
uniref:Uncharacterized protein n=1 Tax=Physcomitrium patens TaxID=3218 RepID=A0A2K1IS59_PHYPA|nr:hypothetical protein PHYPA_026241 [Physcomitrium patens]